MLRMSALSLALLGMLSACGHTPEERLASGLLIGAAAGAAIGLASTPDDDDYYESDRHYHKKHHKKRHKKRHHKHRHRHDHSSDWRRHRDHDDWQYYD